MATDRKDSMMTGWQHCSDTASFRGFSQATQSSQVSWTPGQLPDSLVHLSAPHPYSHLCSLWLLCSAQCQEERGLSCYPAPATYTPFRPHSSPDPLASLTLRISPLHSGSLFVISLRRHCPNYKRKKVQKEGTDIFPPVQGLLTTSVPNATLIPLGLVLSLFFDCPPHPCLKEKLAWEANPKPSPVTGLLQPTVLLLLPFPSKTSRYHSDPFVFQTTTIWPWPYPLSCKYTEKTQQNFAVAKYNFPTFKTSPQASSNIIHSFIFICLAPLPFITETWSLQGLLLHSK